MASSRAWSFSSARDPERQEDLSVVGKTSSESAICAKVVNHTRLSFPEDEPVSDLTPLYDEPHRTVFADPLKRPDRLKPLTTPPKQGSCDPNVKP